MTFPRLLPDTFQTRKKGHGHLIRKTEKVVPALLQSCTEKRLNWADPWLLKTDECQSIVLLLFKLDLVLTFNIIKIQFIMSGK